MVDYFGKRGMTVSVEVFIFKSFETYHKQVYLVALDRSDQGALETLCIADIVLQQFKKDYPQIARLDLKTDNAGSTFGSVMLCAIIMYFLKIRKLPRQWNTGGHVQTCTKTRNNSFCVQF